VTHPSGPRLSYFGVQIAVAFYLINLSEFRVQTSLELGRDRVIGIFLGFLVMWLSFDHLWAEPTVIVMKKTFIGTFRLLAEFAKEPHSKDLREAITRSYSLREMINKNFDSVRAFADAIPLEFGASRVAGLGMAKPHPAGTTTTAHAVFDANRALEIPGPIARL
jgi:multidrug resistance protein MdtO